MTFDPTFRIHPPVAERRPHSRTLWGETVDDPLAWLADRDDPGVVEFLKSENAYAESIFAQFSDLEDTIFSEIKSRIKETDLSVPIAKDGWEYYSRTVEGQSYPIHCRRPTGQPNDEIVLLDENVEAGEEDFFDLGQFDVSHDHRFVLWGWDRTGDERYDATIRDLTTGIDTSEFLHDITSTAWSLDGRHIFYVTPDEALRPYQVWRHEVGTDQSCDVCLYTEADERFGVGIGTEKDNSYIQIAIGSKITDEVWVIPAAQALTPPRLVAERREGVEYSVAHREGQFIILTNDGGLNDDGSPAPLIDNFRVMVAPADSPEAGSWVPLHGDDMSITDLDITAEYMILFGRVDGLTKIRVRRWSDGKIWDLNQAEKVSTVWPGANPEYETTKLRYGYGSMVTPSSVLSVELTTNEVNVLKQEEVGSGYNPDDYRSERLWASAGDGVEIPISIVYRADRDAAAGPCLLSGYGAYEVSIDPVFSPARLSLLDRGFVVAIAHVRGGGEMGRPWYLEGKFEAKTNSFDDLVACARHLIDQGWTAPEQLALRGGSAGGLLVGAALNRAPELFGAVVSQVPFVDALNTICDETLPLTIPEWEEWGNPKVSESIYRVMRGYSPYENVGDVSYPTVLATAGFHDSRVGYWEAVKWIQKIREHSTSDAPVVAWTDLGSGHGGPSGRYDAWREESRILAYTLWAVAKGT